MKRLVVCLTVLSGMAMDRVVRAEEGPHSITLQLGGSSTNNEFEWGEVSPNAKNVKAADSGGAFGIQYLYHPPASPHLGFGVDLQHSALDENVAQQTFTNLDSASRFRPTVITGLARVGFSGGPVRPYLFGGLGFHITEMELRLTPSGSPWLDTGTTETRTIVDGTDTSIALSFGTGLDWMVTKAFFLGLEFRVLYLGDANYGVTAAGQALGFSEAEGDLSLTTLFIRTGFRFGARS